MAALILITVFVVDTMSRRYIKVEDKKSSETEVNVRIVTNTIKVYDQNNNLVSQYKTVYDDGRKNTESVLDLLDFIREEQDFFYEKTAYIYGTELDSINKMSISQDYVWQTYKYADGELEDISLDIHKVSLENDQEYHLIPVQKS